MGGGPVVGGPIVGGPIGGGPIIGGGAPFLSPPLCGRKGGNPLARTLDVENPVDIAEFGEYPWMAAVLRLDLTYLCGAALIDINIVVTAAHCVARYANCNCTKLWFGETPAWFCRMKGQELIVRLGEYDVEELQEQPFQDVHVRDVIIHGGYHSGTLRNDIAVLTLDVPAHLNAYIKPVCLPPPQDMSGLICTVTGWGRNGPRKCCNSILATGMPKVSNRSVLRRAFFEHLERSRSAHHR